MVQIFVYTKVHVKWGLTNMSNNHFTTKTIWTLSRCYFATSNKFFHNPNSAMHFYSYTGPKDWKFTLNVEFSKMRDWTNHHFT